MATHADSVQISVSWIKGKSDRKSKSHGLARGSENPVMAAKRELLRAGFHPTEREAIMSLAENGIAIDWTYADGEDLAGGLASADTVSRMASRAGKLGFAVMTQKGKKGRNSKTPYRWRFTSLLFETCPSIFLSLRHSAPGGNRNGTEGRTGESRPEGDCTEAKSKFRGIPPREARQPRTRRCPAEAGGSSGRKRPKMEKPPTPEVEAQAMWLTREAQEPCKAALLQAKFARLEREGIGLTPEAARPILEAALEVHRLRPGTRSLLRVVLSSLDTLEDRQDMLAQAAGISRQSEAKTEHPKAPTTPQSDPAEAILAAAGIREPAALLRKLPPEMRSLDVIKETTRLACISEGKVPEAKGWNVKGAYLRSLLLDAKKRNKVQGHEEVRRALETESKRAADLERDPFPAGMRCHVGHIPKAVREDALALMEAWKNPVREDSAGHLAWHDEQRARRLALISAAQAELPPTAKQRLEQALASQLEGSGISEGSLVWKRSWNHAWTRLVVRITPWIPLTPMEDASIPRKIGLRGWAKISELRSA